MRILKNFRDTFLALLPIMVIVLVVHLFFYAIPTDLLVKFYISIILICLGESLFLSGIDSTIKPMGELMIGSVNKVSKFFVFVMFAFLFGLCATVAEPDVNIFTDQVIESGLMIKKGLFLFCIGAGVGLFIAIAIFRIIKSIELKYIYIVMFAIIFLLATQVDAEQIALAFDAGGATTGIVTAPFLLVISSGIASKFSKNKDSKENFGMVGLASIGPVLLVLLFFACNKIDIATGVVSQNEINLFVSVLSNSMLALLPVAIVFFIYDILLIKLPIKRKCGLLIGLVITFIGFFTFLFGIKFGVIQLAENVGENFIAKLQPGVIILISIALGFIITFSEPAVIVLAKQVKSATNGSISYVFVLISIAISMSAAVTLAALKAIYSINFFYIILIGYSISLILMFFVPEVFTGLAFDSGGVASGPMTSSFILPLILALAEAETSNPLNGFGLIGIIGMCPIVVLQLLGLVYRFKVLGKSKKDHKKAIRISYTMDLYSNMENLEAEYKKLKKVSKNEKR